jgi:hypothetical protein
VEDMPLAPQYPHIAQNGQPKVAPEEWGEFKSVLIRKSDKTVPMVLR